MPHALIVFKLPEEQEEFDDWRQASAYRAVLGEVWNKCRSKVKYEDIPESEREIYEQVKAWIGEECQGYGLEIP